MKIRAILFIILFTPVFAIAQNIYFPPKEGDTWDTIAPESLSWCQNNIDSLNDFLEENNTKAFILLKDGKIVIEKYFGTHNQNSLWYWASAGKTITAFMVGIAQQEKYLSIANTVSKYLGKGWTNCTPLQEGKITVRHQLTMTSGLDDGVPDSYCTLKNCLSYKADAGTRWAYHNAPYTLLDKVIENATGVTLNSYITQKLKNKTGMTGMFIPVDYNNVFFSNARSMARFGLLALNKGNWDGTQIMTDTAYFNQMIHTSQKLNQAYGYLWWMNSTSTFMLPQTQFVFKGQISPNAPFDMFAAMGKDGQFINVVPGENLVWIRMGEAPENLEVPFLLNEEIWQRINKLECKPVSSEVIRLNGNPVSIFPNPAGDYISIHSVKKISGIELLNNQGQLLKRLTAGENDITISIKEFYGNLFILRIYFFDGEFFSTKIIKE
jgi:CubicO group peptidase (beta-lactamase class C family)